MSPLLLPFQLALLMFSGWVNGHQLDVIEYLQEENESLGLDNVRVQVILLSLRKQAEIQSSRVMCGMNWNELCSKAYCGASGSRPHEPQHGDTDR